MNHATSQIASRAAVRQIDAHARAEDAADAADRAVARVWGEAMRLLAAAGKRPTNLHDLHRQALATFRRLLPETTGTIHDHLAAQARWGHAETAALLTDHLPLDLLRAAAIRKAGADVSPGVRLADGGRAGVPLSVQNGGVQGRVASQEGASARAADQELLVPGSVEQLTEAGVLSFGLRLIRKAAGGIAALFARDNAEPLRPNAPPLPEPEQRALFASLLFPPPSPAEVQRIVQAPSAGVPWTDRLAAATHINGATPERLAGALVAGYAQGKTPREIAKDLLPAVDNVRTTATRIARTEGMRVSHQVQMQGYDALGDMVTGYQINAQLDMNTRPAHAARNGTVYYKSPKPGQNGTESMPQPPQESDGSTAWNCRCWLAPVLQNDDAAKAAIGAAGPAPPPPDHVVYGDWFAGADERRRRIAVGSARYDAVTRAAGSKAVDWEHFVDPQTGGLVATADLKAESPADRMKRLRAVRRQQAELRRKKVEVGAYGFEVSTTGGTAPVAR